MPKYREHFRLSPADLELIEDALRSAIANHTPIDPTDDNFEVSRQRQRRLNEVLGKLYNQKVFYAQVHPTGIPAA